MAVKTTKMQCNQDVDLRGKVTCRKDAEINGKLIVNSATNIKDKSLTSADAGKVLTVNEDGSLSWQQKGVGGGMKAFFDAGGKCGNSLATSFDEAINFNDTADLTSMANMFSWCTRLTSIPAMNTSKVTSMNTMLQECRELTEIPLLDTRQVTNMDYMFDGCSNLKSVPELDVGNATKIKNMFRRCLSLETIHIKNIGSDLDVSQSIRFTREALLEIINNLKTVSSTKTLTLGSNNLAKLTDEDKAIAINKGWTLA